MSSFKGIYSTTIDDKRRLKLPKKLREAMLLSANDQVVIGPGYDGCIFLFPPDEWGKQEDKLRNLEVESGEHRYLERIFMTQSEDVKLDKLGRLTISPRLLERTQIKRDVLILGVLSRIEIWAPEAYQKYLAQYQLSYEEVAERIYKSGKNVEAKTHLRL
jgi:MraZ protein